MSSIIETDLFENALNFSITSKALLNKDIIATVENVVKDLEKEETATILPPYTSVTLALK